MYFLHCLSVAYLVDSNDEKYLLNNLASTHTFDPQSIQQYLVCCFIENVHTFHPIAKNPIINSAST